MVSVGEIILANKTALAKQMDALQLVPRPQRLTELYFTDYRTVTTPIPAGGVQKVAFTVHNLEHHTTRYNYTIIAQTEDGKSQQSLGDGSLTLPANAVRSTQLTLRLPTFDTRFEVKVNLDYIAIPSGGNVATRHTQSIHYWAKIAAPANKDHTGA